METRPPQVPSVDAANPEHHLCMQDQTSTKLLCQPPFPPQVRRNSTSLFCPPPSNLPSSMSTPQRKGSTVAVRLTAMLNRPTSSSAQLQHTARTTTRRGSLVDRTEPHPTSGPVYVFGMSAVKTVSDSTRTSCLETSAPSAAHVASPRQARSMSRHQLSLEKDCVHRQDGPD